MYFSRLFSGLVVRSSFFCFSLGLLLCTVSVAASAQENASAARRGLMNPDISANALFLYTNSNRSNMYDSSSGNGELNGMSLQEAEVQLLSDVDPYTRLNGVLSVHQEAPVSPARSGEWKIEPEEFYVESIALPLVTLRGGKFKAAFGRHNMMHTHAFPFVDQPLVNQVFFGDEGLNDVGLSAATLLPVGWYSELTAQILSGRTENESAFNSRSTNANVYVAHFKNLFDLTDDLTLEFGLSDAYGSNEPRDPQQPPATGVSNLYGSDLTFKWRPSEGGKYHALIWSTEYMNRQVNRSLYTNHGVGYASWLQYQFAQRWWVQARSEYVQAREKDPSVTNAPAEFQRKYSALVGFFPSEFSGARVQYSYLEDGRETPEHKVYLQLNFTIGAHPAHSY